VLAVILLLSACGASAQQAGPIVVPPPASAGVEPSPLAQPAINLNHITLSPVAMGGSACCSAPIMV